MPAAAHTLVSAAFRDGSTTILLACGGSQGNGLQIQHQGVFLSSSGGWVTSEGAMTATALVFPPTTADAVPVIDATGTPITLISFDPSGGSPDSACSAELRDGAYVTCGFNVVIALDVPATVRDGDVIQSVLAAASLEEDGSPLPAYTYRFPRARGDGEDIVVALENPGHDASVLVRLSEIDVLRNGARLTVTPTETYVVTVTNGDP